MVGSPRHQAKQIPNENAKLRRSGKLAAMPEGVAPETQAVALRFGSLAADFTDAFAASFAIIVCSEIGDKTSAARAKVRRFQTFIARALNISICSAMINMLTTKKHFTASVTILFFNQRRTSAVKYLTQILSVFLLIPRSNRRWAIRILRGLQSKFRRVRIAQVLHGQFCAGSAQPGCTNYLEHLGKYQNSST